MEKFDILAVPVAVTDMAGLLQEIQRLINEPECKVALAVNAAAMNLTYKHADYLSVLQNADLVYADGASILLAAKILGKKLPERLCTTDIWPSMCSVAQEKGLTFYLMGDAQGIAAKAMEAATGEYSELMILGTHHGFFDFEDPKIIDMVNKSKPDVLWLGMGDPRQALWADRWKAELDVGIIITCGAMFRWISGMLARMDEKWRVRGFEWWSRLKQDPKHTAKRYILGLPAFGLRVIASKLFDHRRTRDNITGNSSTY
jgi:N-acetylglucosaminyldiphosphoundecaprenol N-acetyl-beta-D-mannosaminyltransferase